VTSYEFLSLSIALLEAVKYHERLLYLPDRVDASCVAAEHINDIEIVNPCSRTIEALHRAEARVPVEFSVQQFAVYRVVHFRKI
jgi:hypothetical protein